MKYISYINSPAGCLRLTTDETSVLEISFCEAKEVNDEVRPEVLKNLETQLQEYFEGKRKNFELELNPEGTDFQKKVWKELVNIPFGKTLSYLDMAKILGDEKVIRAAAAANGKNPIGIVIPCHRVIGQNGKLVGYAGGLPRKKWLLDHESKTAYGNWELF